MASLKYWLWLTGRKLSGPLKLALLDRFGEPDRIYYGEKEEYSLIEGITRAAVASLEDKSMDEANRILGDCQRLGLRILTLRDAEYPERLRTVYNPPLLLYVQGRLPLFDEEVAVAMVGSRKASPYALEMGEKLAFQMAGLGAVIVSGLAAGGDAAAHRGALRAGGFTAAVIGGGHDILYPRENRRLYEDIGARGVILSEYPPGTEHMGRHFPVRNRIISGLSLGVVVTEAPEQSGALITASRALDQGREVFAVPGPIYDPRCEGSNRLLEEGAHPALHAWGVLSCYANRFPQKIRAQRGDLPRRFGQDQKTEKSARPEEPVHTPRPERREPPERPVLVLSGDHGLTDDQIRLVKALRGRTAQADELIEETGIPARRALSALTVLELDEIVTQDAGKQFSLAVTLK